MLDIEFEVNGQRISMIQALSALATLGIINNYKDVETVTLRQNGGGKTIEIEMCTDVRIPQVKIVRVDAGSTDIKYF